MGDKNCENGVLESLKAFKAAGGGCIVENSTSTSDGAPGKHADIAKWKQTSGSSL